MCAASSASAVNALKGSPARKSRFVQKTVIRVLGSAGLKFPSEFNEKGSARIDTDSSATARVEVDETVNNEGEMPGAANTVAEQSIAKPMHRIETKHLRTAKARVFMGRLLKNSRVSPTSEA